MSAQHAGRLIVECLMAQGVECAFGVPGESYLAVLDGFHAHRDRIRFIVNRQERPLTVERPGCTAHLACRSRDQRRRECGGAHMAAVVTLLQKHLPADAAITNGAGNFANWVHRFCRYHGLAKGHKTQLAPTSGAMG